MRIEFKSFNTEDLGVFQKKVLDICLPGGIAIVTVEEKLISDKAFRALHLWFRQCEQELNKYKKPYYGALSGKPRRWQDGDFKQGVYKPFLKIYKNKLSTKDQGPNDVNDCLTALTAHIHQEYDVVLPMFPSIENMSIKALLAS